MAEILDNFLCRNMLRCGTLFSIYLLACGCISTGLTLVYIYIYTYILVRSGENLKAVLLERMLSHALD